MSRVTGSEARDLLTHPDGAAPWIIEQRNLAETIAWLYGHEGDPEDPTIHTVDIYEGRDCDLVSSVPGGLVVIDTDGGYRTPEQAVELARALLTAAEEARRRG